MSFPIPKNYGLFVTNLNTSFGAVYNDTLEPNPFEPILSEVPVTGAAFAAAWTGMMPKARVWSGARVVHTDAPEIFQAVPLPYELTFGIDKFEEGDDLYGVHYRMLPDMARQWRRIKAYEPRDLLESAGAYNTTPLQAGYDGLAYFATNHPIDVYNTAAGTYINDFTGGGVNVNGVNIGGAISPTSFAQVWGYMRKIKGQDGERLGVLPDTLVHPVDIRTEVKLILENEYFAPPAWGGITGQVGAADNQFKRWGVVPHEIEFLNNANTTALASRWYLADTKKAYKPLIWAQREAPSIVPLVSPTDQNMFALHQKIVGGEARAIATWGFSFLMARSGT